jgi:hypothetical protein
MPIPNHAKANFHTLLRAAADGNLALMECLDAERASLVMSCVLSDTKGPTTSSHRSGISPTGTPTTLTPLPILRILRAFCLPLPFNPTGCHPPTRKEGVMQIRRRPRSGEKPPYLAHSLFGRVRGD